MPNIGPMELIVVLVIALVVLGPKRLPGLGKQLGTGMRDFKEAISGNDRDDEDAPALPAASKSEPVATDAAVRPAEPIAQPVEPVARPAEPAEQPAPQTGA